MIQIISIRHRTARLFASILVSALLLFHAQPGFNHSVHAQTRSQTAVTGKEYFSPKVYGAASPRIVEAGAAVPRVRGYRVAGRSGTRREPRTFGAGETQIGKASWYGDAFHGRKTANGEIYDTNAISAAHPSFPLPCYVRVTNLTNGRSLIVRVNDRGPYIGNRVIDFSRRSAQALGMLRAGVADVMITYLGKADLDADDHQTLLATLRTDGSPAKYADLHYARIAGYAARMGRQLLAEAAISLAWIGVGPETGITTQMLAADIAIEQLADSPDRAG